VLEARVPVQVVRGEVEENGDARAEGVDVLELEARELAHDPGLLAQGAVETRERPANVPSHRHVLAGGAEDLTEELARRRLAVRPGDAEDRVVEKAEPQLDLAPDGQHTLSPSGHERGRRRYTWAFHEQVHAVEKLGVVRAEDDFDACLAKPARVDVLPACEPAHP